MSMVPGRTYHRRYGYPWLWAVIAEFWWRVEHCPVGYLRRVGYANRKAAERRGAA